MTDVSFASAEVALGSDEECAEWLYAHRCTDGLPVVIPTAARVDEMLFTAAIAGFDADIVLGEVGPNMGEATVEKVAINAVMAGCLPEYFPVVIAAMKAVCDPRLDITEVQATTHNLTPLIIVNGPVTREIGMAGGYGALGYGHRANLTIGRAVRLCMINLGGGWPALSDMAVLGHPGKLTYCLAEDEESSPFPPLHVSLGFAAEESAVTVTCVGAPHSVIVVPNADDAEAADHMLDIFANAIAGVGNNNAMQGNGTVVLCLNPDHASFLSKAGHTRQSIQTELWKRATNPMHVLQRLRYGTLAPTDTDPNEVQHALASPASVLVIVAGGVGVYSSIMVPWSMGPHKNIFVSKEVITTDACEVPAHTV